MSLDEILTALLRFASHGGAGSHVQWRADACSSPAAMARRAHGRGTGRVGLFGGGGGWVALTRRRVMCIAVVLLAGANLAGTSALGDPDPEMAQHHGAGLGPGAVCVIAASILLIDNLLPHPGWSLPFHVLAMAPTATSSPASKADAKSPSKADVPKADAVRPAGSACSRAVR
jgi:hypothetical protein